jgi:hypothetical protein
LRRGRTVVYVCLGLWLAIFGLNFYQMRNVGVITFPDGVRVHFLFFKILFFFKFFILSKKYNKI